MSHRRRRTHQGELRDTVLIRLHMEVTEQSLLVKRFQVCRRIGQVPDPEAEIGPSTPICRRSSCLSITAMLRTG